MLEHPLQMLLIFCRPWSSEHPLLGSRTSPGTDGPGVTVPSIRPFAVPPARLPALPVVPAPPLLPARPVEFAVPEEFVPGDGLRLAALPAPPGLLTELFKPGALPEAASPPGFPAPAAPSSGFGPVSLGEAMELGEPVAVPVDAVPPLPAPPPALPPPPPPVSGDSNEATTKILTGCEFGIGGFPSHINGV